MGLQLSSSAASPFPGFPDSTTILTEREFLLPWCSRRLGLGAVRFSLSPSSSKQPRELHSYCPHATGWVTKAWGRPGCSDSVFSRTDTVSLERGRNESTQSSDQSEARRTCRAKPHPPPPFLPPRNYLRQPSPLRGAGSLQPASFLLPAVTSEVPRVCQQQVQKPSRGPASYSVSLPYHCPFSGPPFMGSQSRLAVAPFLCPNRSSQGPSLPGSPSSGSEM